MYAQHSPRPAILSLALAFAIAFALAPQTALAFPAPRDRTAPTKPGNFRVTARTAYSVTLAWNASSDNSGSFTYRLWSTAGGNTITLPQNAGSYVWNTNVYPRNSYTFGIYAVDPSGNNSAQANLSTTVPADTTPPSTAPVVSVTDVGPTYISLSWTAAHDDGPYLSYQIYVNGAAYAGAGAALTGSATGLQPGTTYSIRVRAVDYGGNPGPLSAPISVTTDAAGGDTTPPGAPANLADFGMIFQDGELWLFWDDSSDDQTPSNLIRYNVYVNDVLDHTSSISQTIMYITPGIVNVVEVTAVDASGNESAPATATYDLR